MALLTCRMWRCLKIIDCQNGGLERFGKAKIIESSNLWFLWDTFEPQPDLGTMVLAVWSMGARESLGQHATWFQRALVKPCMFLGICFVHC